MFTVSTSKKTPLNDQLYAQLHMHQPRRKMSLQTPVCTWSTFSKSLMASIAESQVIDWQYTNLTLVHHKVEVSEAYCRKSMLLQVSATIRQIRRYRVCWNTRTFEVGYAKHTQLQTWVSKPYSAVAHIFFWWSTNILPATLFRSNWCNFR